MLLVGLGNPGSRYAHNRHNVGFMAVEAIARQHGFSTEKSRFQGLIQEGFLAGEKYYILKPQTYMNESGQSVGEMLRFYNIPLNDVVVFHDELDVPPFEVRAKSGGGHGGHNGLKSITAHTGSDYHRIRIGIGHPGHKDAVTPWVLGDFAKAESGVLDCMVASMAKEATLLHPLKLQLFAKAVNTAVNAHKKNEII